MSQYFQIHSVNPQGRLIHQAVEIIKSGGVIAYPTDSAYALGCHIGDKKALDRLRQIRRLDNQHNFTLVCRDLSEVSVYAKVSNYAYRYLNSHTPGAYTFILEATREVPKRLMHPKRRTIGLRVPQNAIVSALLAELNEPLMSTTLILPGEDMPMTDADEIRGALERQLELVIDGGHCGAEATTVVDLTEDDAKITRKGKGETGPFEV